MKTIYTVHATYPDYTEFVVAVFSNSGDAIEYANKKNRELPKDDEAHFVARSYNVHHNLKNVVEQNHEIEIS